MAAATSSPSRLLGRRACDDIWVRECSDGSVQEFR